MALIDVFRYYSDRFQEAERPWRLGPWVWATNSHLLVALTDDGRDADETPGRVLKGRRYLENAAEGETAASLVQLRTFAGAVRPAHVDCENCLGSGVDGFGDLIKCEHCGQDTRTPCPSCGGDGNAPIDIRYGRVVGVPVNRTLLGFGLAQVPSDPDAITIGYMTSPAEKRVDALIVLGAGWRVALMGCVDVPNDVPVFMERSASAAKVAAVDPVGERVTG